MADYISRASALVSIESAAAKGRSFLSLFHEVADIPAADVAPVVRCLECKYRGDYDNCPAANSSNYDMKDYDFCSYGEKEATND